ncbi:MAG TPA: NAD(+)/NADH kinase [Planctomycetota bacterium]
MPTRNGVRPDAIRFPTSREARVLILPDLSKAGAEELARRLEGFLEDRAEVVGVESARESAPIALKPDLVIVLGGDGALLATSHRLGARQVPVMGLNFGNVGFLAAVAPTRAREVLDEVFDGKGVREDHALMHTKVVRGEKTLIDTHILNEVVLMRAWTSPLCEVDLTVDRRPVCSYRGDGVIVATATGSTAYSLAAGGPLLSPRLDAWVVTPIAPYMLGMRPLVLPGQRVAILTVRSQLGFSADGREECDLLPGDVVRVGPSRRRFQLVVDPKANFFARLRAKLRWGEAPGPG